MTLMSKFENKKSDKICPRAPGQTNTGRVVVARGLETRKFSDKAESGTFLPAGTFPSLSDLSENAESCTEQDRGIH